MTGAGERVVIANFLSIRNRARKGTEKSLSWRDAQTNMRNAYFSQTTSS